MNEKRVNLGRLAGTISAAVVLFLVAGILFSIAIKFIIFIWTGEW